MPSFSCSTRWPHHVAASREWSWGSDNCFGSRLEVSGGVESWRILLATIAMSGSHEALCAML
jgi:hypothetical protein